MRLDWEQQPIEADGVTVDAEHPRDRETPHIRVEYADPVPGRRKCAREVDRDGRLADTARGTAPFARLRAVAEIPHRGVERGPCRELLALERLAALDRDERLEARTAHRGARFPPLQRCSQQKVGATSGREINAWRPGVDALLGSGGSRRGYGRRA